MYDNPFDSKEKIEKPRMKWTIIKGLNWLLSLLLHSWRRLLPDVRVMMAALMYLVVMDHKEAEDWAPVASYL